LGFLWVARGWVKGRSGSVHVRGSLVRNWASSSRGAVAFLKIVVGLDWAYGSNVVFNGVRGVYMLLEKSGNLIGVLNAFL
jgi:hypothetical protein